MLPKRSPHRETPPDPEQLKRRRERILIAILLVLVVVITTVEIRLVHRGGQPVTGSLLAFGLLNLNTFLLLLFTFLIFRHLSKLFLERRRKVFGSRLRTRLVLAFISLTLLPTLFLFFMAWQLISSRVDYSWDRQVEQSLGQALAVSRDVGSQLKGKLLACAREMSLELMNHADLSRNNRVALEDFLTARRKAFHLSGVEILNLQGEVVAASFTPDLNRLPPHIASGKDLTASDPEKIIREIIPKGELLTLSVPFEYPKGFFDGYVVVRQLIPQARLLQIAAAAKSLQDLRQRHLLFSPVKVSHYLTLIIVTLIAIMAAIWLAFYMARAITTPIRQLAEGTVKVAGGDYDIHIDQEGRDEIGFLVQSFNKMTHDLQQSQAQLATAYRQLSDSHALISTQKRDMEILLKNVAAGVIGIDAEGRVTIINDSAAQMLQVKREDVLGREGRVLLPPGEYNRMAEVVAEARKSPRGTVEKPLHLVLPDQTLYLMVKPTVLKDEEGRDLGLVVVFEDLTELERAQRLAAWREVARRIAHEVKNPLTPIRLAAQRLQRRFTGRLGPDEQIFGECSQTIISQVDELKNLVNEFSRFARLPQLTLASQDLNGLIQETLLLYQEVQPRISMEFHPDPDLPLLLLDREQVKRMLLNLLDNALAAIPGSGTITVSVKGDRSQERVELIVADTGVGIPDRDKIRIFEPYFSTKRGGTGLGLAIVNSIVSEHQGFLRVEDNVPRGTRFIIEIPMHRADYVENAAGS
ncbi:MAG: ATP-binding protein [Deltaproteobacteria bacterium]|jgi:two-component system, NtrC family, nitrogen regulation sensor histidine kinase NtrY